MAKTEMRKQLEFMTPDTPGVLGKVCESCRDAGANIDAICAYGMEGKATFMMCTSDNVKAMEALKKLTAPKARVLRGGNEVIVPAREIVPGDIVLFEAGDRVPADARLLEVVDLKADEAILTGESAAISKDLRTVKEKASIGDRKNSVFMATHMTYGRGKAVVTSTGMNTEFGKIAEMVQTMEVEESPLKQKLERFAKKLGVAIVLICIVIFALALYEVFVLGISHGADPLTNIVEAFETAIALAVSAVPEGLPAVVTASLALGASKLAKKNSIIRRLSSAEFTFQESCSTLR